jgi:hypothetical protein
MAPTSGEQIKRLDLVLPEVQADLLPPDDPGEQVGIGRRRVVERKADPHVLVLRLGGCLLEVPGRDLARVSATETLNHRQRPIEPDPAGAARHDQLAGQLRVAGGYAKGDEAAERLPQQDRPVDLQRSTEIAHIIDPGIEMPPLRCAWVAAAIATVIEEHELRHISQRRQMRLQHAVVKARAAVQAHHDRPPPHARPVRHQPHPGNVKVETDIADLDTHGVTVRPAPCQ